MKKIYYWLSFVLLIGACLPEAPGLVLCDGVALVENALPFEALYQTNRAQLTTVDGLGALLSGHSDTMLHATFFITETLTAHTDVSQADFNNLASVLPLHTTAYFTHKQQVLLMGGVNNTIDDLVTWVNQDSLFSDKIIKYDVATQQLANVDAHLLVPRAGHTTTKVTDGVIEEVLVVGGNLDTAKCSLITASYEPYFVTNNSHTLRVNRYLHKATAWQNSAGSTCVLITGGQKSNDGSIVGEAELYQYRVGFLEETIEQKEPRLFHTATFIEKNNTVILTGGQSNQGVIKATIEAYDITNKLFLKEEEPMKVARAKHTATCLPDKNWLLIVGGQAANGAAINSIELYADGKTYLLEQSLLQARFNHATIFVRDEFNPAKGYLLVFGGCNEQNTPLKHEFLTVYLECPY